MGKENYIMNRKSHIFLWSGGFDSTAILLNMISNPDIYSDVRVIGCGLKNANNYEEDKTARKNISKILEIPNSRITYAEQELDISANNGKCGMQAPIWAWLSAFNVENVVDKETVMVYGFIRGDDYWHYRQHFESSVTSMAKIHTDNPIISFQYPLEWLIKKEIVSWYIQNPDVFRAISWGGDTATVKAKEREELEFLYEEILKAAKTGTIKNEEIKSKEVVREFIPIGSQASSCEISREVGKKDVCSIQIGTIADAVGGI